MAEGSQSLRFHRSLYAPEAVDEAVRAFADLAKLTVLHNPNDTLVVIDEPSADVAGVLADELANFALAETVARSRTLTVEGA